MKNLYNLIITINKILFNFKVNKDWNIYFIYYKMKIKIYYTVYKK